MKSKFVKILSALILIWLLGLIAFGIKFYIDLTVPESDQLAIQQLEKSILEFHTAKGFFPGTSELSTVDADLESDARLMNWMKPDDKNTAEAKALLDSKGNYFRIRLDSNKDGSVYSPIDKEPISKSILIWSAGKDGKFVTWRDNGRSWE